MTEINYPEIILKAGREAALLRGHPWVFSGAIAKIKGHPSDGDVVLALDSRNQALALGFFNSKTDISFRVLERNCARGVDAAFWEERVARAAELRERIIDARTNAFRLINAEGDGCPGLIVDVYDRTLAMSISTAGMEKQRRSILDALVGRMKPAGIYEHSAGRSR
ncbi:MAG: hypothetical protein EG826_07355, partial [Deltaproteobacteria bacterium]|nr:hypothetical protein [Deltaproteobacteria bacterium]